MTDTTRQELAALWCAVFGEAPPIVTDPELTAGVMVRCLPSVGPYRPEPTIRDWAPQAARPE